MAGRSRLSALKLLERINRHEMESIGATLVALRASQAEIEQKKSALTEEALREARDSTLDSRPYLPAYLTSVDTAQRQLSDAHDKIEQDVVATESKLLHVFRDAKANDAVMGRVTKEIAVEEERAETARLDDATRALHQLQKAQNAD